MMSRLFTRYRPALASLALVFCLGGCGNFAPRTSPTVDIYDFGPLPHRAEAAHDWRMALDVRMPSWFESLPVDYRLDYDDPLLQRAYANSRWAAAPTVMIARQLRRQLGMNDNGLAAECVLRVEVDDFVQAFASPQASRGVLGAVVTLVDAKRRPLATLPVHLEEAAATPDARGGVHALVVAANRLGERIDAWLAALDSAGRLKVCQPAGG